MDVKYVTPELSGLPHTVYLYAIIDIWSRWKQGVILPAIDQALAVEALKVLIPLLPDNLREQLDFIQTDNGLEFQSKFHSYVVDELGWKHHHTHKSSPNENAVIERSFRTDEEEFFWRMEQPEDEIDLNLMYQQYLNDYNTYRPHLGIDLKTPEEKLLSYTRE
jgi:transposase InsO family protein